MTLRARLGLTLGRLRLDAELEATAGATVAVVGPNGAGKTTALRALAGLVPLSEGRVELDGQVLDDPAAGVWVPPERRPIAVVFQDHLLFPHLSALENVAFGLRSRGVPRRAARERAAALLDRFGLTDHAAARPRALSGGQAQRVALARALAVEPRLLLLDEPLAALDAATRLHVRAELRHRLADAAAARLLVTHDPVEAMVLADRLVVLEEGRVVQSGTPDAISRHPRSPYVARLVGVNLYRGVVRGTRLLVAGGGELHLAEPPGADGTDAFATVRPQAVALFRERPDGTPRNVWQGRVTGWDVERERVRVDLAGPLPVVAEVTPAALTDLGLAAGSAVWVAVKATDVDGYPA